MPLIALCVALSATGAARAGAPGETAGGVPASPAAPMAGPNGADPCADGTLSVPLTLLDAVSHTLCANPKTRSAWATIKLNAAALAIAKENYYPTLSGTAKAVHSATSTHLNQLSALDTYAASSYPEETLSFSWVLYDFGERGAELDSARQLLAAARADLDLSLQQVFLQATADYYGAQAAQASLDSAREIETLANSSVGAAHARVDKGVAPISDELQAQTAYAQAVVNRVKVEAELSVKRGALASDMGLDPDTAISVPPAAEEVHSQSTFTESLHELIEQAKRTHPSVAVAAGQLAAAEADERAARAHVLPSFSLLGGFSRSNEPLTPNLGSPSVPGNVSNWSVGVEVDVPLSDALWKRGIIARAHAQVQVQQEALYGAQQQIAEDVWDSYTAVQAGTANLSNSQALLESARRSLESAQRRYEGGAGTILELLSAQSAYANASQQRIQALSDWRVARLALGASLGRLTLSDAQEGR